MPVCVEWSIPLPWIFGYLQFTLLFSFPIYPQIIHCMDRAIAQAINHSLSTAAARVRALVCSSGFVVDTVALGHVSSE
jgi:hypothetical protein